MRYLDSSYLISKKKTQGYLEHQHMLQYFLRGWEKRFVADDPIRKGLVVVKWKTGNHPTNLSKFIHVSLAIYQENIKRDGFVWPFN